MSAFFAPEDRAFALAMRRTLRCEREAGQQAVPWALRHGVCRIVDVTAAELAAREKAAKRNDAQFGRRA